MTYERLAYDDPDTALRMSDDCHACSTRIDLPRQRVDDSAITMPAPSLVFGRFPHDAAKPEIEVTQAAAHLASRLHLHLD